ncbi:hypothetical protein MY1884_009401 [Beauveria asiatica]
MAGIIPPVDNNFSGDNSHMPKDDTSHDTFNDTQRSTDSADLTRPSDLTTVSQLVKEIANDAGLIAAGEENARQVTLEKLRKLTLALETPRETMIRHCWAMTGSIAGLAWGAECGLWESMVKNGDRAQTVDELASSTGADAILMSNDQYKPTGFSKALGNPSIAGGIIGMVCTTGAGALKFHEYSRKRAFQNPADSKDTSLMYAYATDKDLFSWIQSQGYGKHFNDHMVGYHPWPWMSTDRFPIRERLIEGADKNADASFLVDLGGSLGQDLTDLSRYYPEIPGKLILQDLPPVISQIKNPKPEFIPMAHDFLTEQPIKGARAYYMHSTLHDWPDDVCETILAHIKAAMKPGYSKILVHENVIPTTKASWEATALDMVMLTLFSSQERNEAQWRSLLEAKAGLKITKIWKLDLPNECLIECDLE